MARTGVTNGHSHEIDLTKMTGQTMPTNDDTGHVHNYDLKKGETEPADDIISEHTHTIPKA